MKLFVLVMLLSVSTYAENCTTEFKFGDKVKIIGLAYKEDFPDFYIGTTAIVYGKWISHSKDAIYNVCTYINKVTCVPTGSFKASSLKKQRRPDKIGY